MKIQKIYVSFEKYTFMQKMFALQIKYKSFLNIYSFCKKTFFDHKKVYLLNFVVNSIIWSLKFRKHPTCGIP